MLQFLQFILIEHIEPRQFPVDFRAKTFETSTKLGVEILIKKVFVQHKLAFTAINTSYRKSMGNVVRYEKLDAGGEENSHQNNCHNKSNFPIFGEVSCEARKQQMDACNERAFVF